MLQKGSKANSSHLFSDFHEVKEKGSGKKEKDMKNNTIW